MIEHWSSSLLSTGCLMPLKGNWPICCHAVSGPVGKVWSANEKSLEKVTRRADSEIHLFSHWAIMTRAMESADSRFIHSPTELWWPRLHGEQTVSYPTEISWPGPERRQTVRCIHSPTDLSWPGRWRGQTVRFICSPTELLWVNERGSAEQT